MTRFGVCGTAFWAENVHIPGLQSNPDIELVGVWGRNASRVAELAAATGVQAFQSFEHMVDSVDALSFVVPPAVQAELAPLAIERGKHVFLEKPLGHTSESALKIMRSLADNKVAGLCFLTRMFVGEMSDFVDRARAIDPARGEASFRSDALLGGPYSGSPWRQEEHGALWDAAPHGMSVLVSVLGDVGEVAATASADGSYAFSFRHPGGSTSSFELNLRDPSVKLAERYSFANGETVELPTLAYNRRETFSYAAGLLLEEIAGARDESRSRLGLGLHLVCVAEAAQKSLARGGDFVPVSTPDV
jgi:predicted dehydrogenase